MIETEELNFHVAGTLREEECIVRSLLLNWN